MARIHTSQRLSLLGTSWKCSCGAVHEVPVREVVIEHNAIARVPRVMQSLGLTSPVWIISDENTQQAAGEKLASVLGKKGIRVKTHILEGIPKAEYNVAEKIASEVPADASTIISCGSGTITDLGKWAANKRSLPQIAVATAPSMNGYASGIVALTKDGLKITAPVTPAIAVIADLDVLIKAPMEMILAGLGDILSKPVCNADWRLSSLIRGDHFCIKPFELISDLEEIYTGRAHLLQKRDLEAIKALTEALVFAGISMLIAGSSQPASGGEHLIAHFLDMRAQIEGREPDFHGVEVGIGTIATAKLYELIFRTKIDSIDSNLVDEVWERGNIELARCSELLPHAAESIKSEFAKKRGSSADAVKEARKIIEKWNEIKSITIPFLRPASEIKTILESAGAKTEYNDIGVSRETFRNALAVSFCIRNRFTILDVAFISGLINVWIDDN